MVSVLFLPAWLLKNYPWPPTDNSPCSHSGSTCGHIWNIFKVKRPLAGVITFRRPNLWHRVFLEWKTTSSVLCSHTSCCIFYLWCFSVLLPFTMNSHFIPSLPPCGSRVSQCYTAAQVMHVCSGWKLLSAGRHLCKPTQQHKLSISRHIWKSPTL